MGTVPPIVNESTTEKALAQMVKTFGDYFPKHSVNLHPEFARIKEAAFEQFRSAGFPTNKNEEWKYTSVLPLLKMGFYPVLSRGFGSHDQLNPSDYLIPGLKANLLVMVNGFYEARYSRMLDSPDVLKVHSLLDDSIPQDAAVTHWAKVADSSQNPFVALNTALAPGGVCVEVAEGKSTEFPVHLMHITTGGQVSIASWGRVLWVMNENSEAHVIESHHTEDSGSWGTEVTEVVLKKDARLHWTEIQNDKASSYLVAAKQFELGPNAFVHSDVATLGGSFARNNLNIKLSGERAEAILKGLYLVTDNTLADHHTLVDHAVPNCHSDELYKGVLSGNAKGVFNGKIFVRKDAQKTNAFQSNKNLLLSDTAEINTKPQLEIFADDVKCSHGATTGRLDESAMFYLRSRGLSTSVAKTLLTQAFASEVFENIYPEAVREYLLSEIEKKILSSQADS